MRYCRVPLIGYDKPEMEGADSWGRMGKNGRGGSEWERVEGIRRDRMGEDGVLAQGRVVICDGMEADGATLLDGKKRHPAEKGGTQRDWS